jgi:ParB family transcriptional regulator, chromosome partitioning protein
VLKAYREGKLALEQVMAFAVSDDHAAQEQVLENLRPHQRDPRIIRDALTENEIPASDRRVKFVTLKAYEKAGGKLREDLFSEGEDRVFVLDAALLDRLAAEKLATAAQGLGKEGWKWTEARAVFGHDEQGQFRGLRAEFAPLPPNLAKEAKKLEAEAAKLERRYDEAGEDAEYPERLDEIRDRLDEIERSREETWTPEKLAMAGAVVTIGHDGKPEIMRGLVRPEDMPKQGKKGKAKDASKDASTSGEDEAEESQSSGLSAALVENLTAHKSAALAAELAERPDVALVAVVYTVASRVLFDLHAEDGSLQIAAFPQSLRRVEGAKAFEKMEAARKKWRGQVPEKAEDLWTWCLAQKQDTLLKLLAFCAADTVHAVQGKSDRTESERLSHVRALASALKLDMTAWFMPDAANYFSRVSKRQILDALKEGRNQPPAPAWEKLKKGELAQLAERELSGKGWLPELLRPAA